MSESPDEKMFQEQKERREKEKEADKKEEKKVRHAIMRRVTRRESLSHTELAAHSLHSLFWTMRV